MCNIIDQIFVIRDKTLRLQIGSSLIIFDELKKKYVVWMLIVEIGPSLGSIA